MRNAFRYFNSSPEVIRLAVMMYIRYPLSPRQVEDLLFERGIDIRHETVPVLVEPVRPAVCRGGLRWSHFVGQFGGLVKVYSGVRSCRQILVYHVLLVLLSRWRCG